MVEDNDSKTFHIKTKSGLKSITEERLQAMLESGKVKPSTRAISLDEGKSFITVDEALEKTDDSEEIEWEIEDVASDEEFSEDDFNFNGGDAAGFSSDDFDFGDDDTNSLSLYPKETTKYAKYIIILVGVVLLLFFTPQFGVSSSASASMDPSVARQFGGRAPTSFSASATILLFGWGTWFGLLTFLFGGGFLVIQILQAKSILGNALNVASRWLSLCGFGLLFVINLIGFIALLAGGYSSQTSAPNPYVQASASSSVYPITHPVILIALGIGIFLGIKTAFSSSRE